MYAVDPVSRVEVRIARACGHDLVVFWRREAPDDLVLYHGDDPTTRTCLYDTTDLINLVEKLVNNEDYTRWWGRSHRAAREGA